MPESTGSFGFSDGLKDGIRMVAVPFLATLLGIHLGWYVAGQAPLLAFWPPNMAVNWVFIFVFCWVWLGEHPIGLIPLALVLVSAWRYWWYEEFRSAAFVAIVASSAPLGWGGAGGFAPSWDRIAVAVVFLVGLFLAIRYVPRLWGTVEERIARERVEREREAARELDAARQDPSDMLYRPPAAPAPPASAPPPSKPQLGFFEDDGDPPQPTDRAGG